MLKKISLSTILIILCLNIAHSYNVISIGTSHQVIEINGRFVGKEITIFGTKGAPGDIVIVVSGDKGPVSMKKLTKKRLGMWLVDEVLKFENVPSLYMVHSTRKLSEIVNNAEQYTPFSDLNDITIHNQNRHIMSDWYKFTGASKILIDQYKKYGLFVENDSINIVGDGSLFEIRSLLPSRLKEGKYSIVGYLIQGGDIVGMHVIPFIVKKVGFSGFISKLLITRDWLYSALTILIAISMGSTMNYIIRVILNKNE